MQCSAYCLPSGRAQRIYLFTLTAVRRFRAGHGTGAKLEQIGARGTLLLSLSVGRGRVRNSGREIIQNTEKNTVLDQTDKKEKKIPCLDIFFYIIPEKSKF